MPDNTPNTGQNVERVAAFIEDEAKKVQEKQANSNFNQFDFGYKSPSSNFGSNKSDKELAENQAKGLKAQGYNVQDVSRSQGGSWGNMYDKTEVSYKSKNGLQTAMFDNFKSSSSIVSAHSMDNVSVNNNKNATSRKGINNNIPGSNQVVNGRVQINRQKGDTTRLTVNDTNEIKSPIAGKFGVQGNQFQPRTGSVGPNGNLSSFPGPGGNSGNGSGVSLSSPNGNNYGTSSTANARNISGTYNTGRHDMTGIANAVIQSTKEQYSEAESYKGNQQMQHRGSLYGVGTINRSLTKFAVGNNLYANRTVDAVKLNTLFNPYGGTNFTYKVGQSRTGDLVSDYNGNLRAVENYLSTHNINAKNLNRWELEKALSSGKLKHWYHQGDNIAIPKGSDIEFALKELLFLRKEGDIVKKYQKASGGLKNTGKAWINEATRDSDVHTGYSVASASVKVGKATLATGDILTRGVIKSGAGVYYNAQAIPLKVQQLSTKYRLSKTGDAQKIAEYKKSLNDIKSKINVKKTKKYEVKQKINKFRPIKNTKINIKNKFVAKRESLFIFKKYRAIQDRLQKSALGKLIGGAASKIKHLIAIFKWVIIGGVILLIIVGIIDVLLIAATSIGGGSSATVTNTVERNADTTMSQKTIDFLHDYQYCYTNNLYKCDPTAIDQHARCPEGGCLMIEKKLPQSWFDKMKAQDSWITENKACIQYMGSDAGFNLSKYWGQYVDKSGNPNGIPAANISNKAPTYTSSVTLATDEFETVVNDDGSTYEKRIYVTKPITICGNAGLEGLAGTFEGNIYDYPEKYNYYKTKNSIKNDNIDGEMDALEKWEAKENTDLTVTYYYRGSQYSCHITGTPSSYYFNTNGEKIKYNIDELYKSFLTMAAGVTDNNDSDVEDHEFYKLYSKRLFDQVMDDAKLVLTYKIVPDSTQKLEWYFNDTHPEGEKNQHCISYGYKCQVNLKIYINNCGIADMMGEDAKVCYGEEGDLWMHENLDRSVNPLENRFKEMNKNSPDYVAWLTTSHEDAITEGLHSDNEWKMPIWGRRQNEEWDTIKTHYTSGYSSHANIEHKYTNTMADAIELNNLTVEDWHNIIDGIKFPSEIDIANFVDEETWEAIQSMTGIINEDITDWDEVDWSKYTTGDVNLDNFLQFAVKQGLIQNETGKEGLCCFTTYCMIGMYMHPEKAQWIKANLANLAEKYCEDDGYTNTPDLMAELGFSRGDYVQYSQSSVKQAVSDQLAEGKPMILHFTKSIYEPDGTKVYGFKNGTGTHFMAVYACTDTTVSVCDPATGGQRTMSWDAFYKAQESGGLRTVSAN